MNSSPCHLPRGGSPVSILHVVFNPQLVAGELDLSVVHATVPAVIRMIGAPDVYQLEIPADASADVRITGFTAEGQTYSITAITQVEGSADATWQASGIDALSPVFPSTGDYEIRVTATAGSAATATRKLSTVTMKVRQPGKPDDFLA